MNALYCQCRHVLMVGAVVSLAFCASGRAHAQNGGGKDAAFVAPEGVVSASTATAQAEDPAKQAVRAWKGEAEAGVINATGNSSSESVRARIKLQYESGQWKHGLTGDFVRVKEQGATTTEQYNATFKSDRSLTKRSYAFAVARYETDRIAGYSPRVAESAGYGRKFPFTEQVRLETEAGVGGRHTWFMDSSRKSEAILRLAVLCSWKFGPLSELSEEAFTEFGEKNVHTESQTSLKTRINDDFALKVNVQVKHDTVVIAERHKTDTITSVTLVYDL